MAGQLNWGLTLATCACLAACGGGDDNPATPTDAQHCFDVSLYQAAGNTWEIDFKNVTSQFPDTVFTYAYSVDATNTSFGNSSGLTKVTRSELSSGMRYQTFYFSPLGPGQWTVHGHETHASMNTFLSSHRVETYAPPFADTRGLLKVGETMRINLNGQYALTGSAPAQEGSINASLNVSYLGDERIQLPAGDFPACVFESNGERQWIWRGIPVQWADASGVYRQAVALRRDGKPLTP